MFLRIAGARSAKQSGIKGVKIPFDPNISVRSIAQGAGRDKWETDGTETANAAGSLFSLRGVRIQKTPAPRIFPRRADVLLFSILRKLYASISTFFPS